MSEQGWIKLHRKMLDNPLVMKDGDYLAVWVYLLLKASHKNHRTLLGGKTITLRPGQLITGRKKMAKELGINEHKIERVLKAFKIEQQIEQQGTPLGSVITILSWDKYQLDEQPNEQQVSNLRATSEHYTRMERMKEGKEVSNFPAKISQSVISYLNQRTGSRYYVTASVTKKVGAILNAGHTEDDIREVIDKKCSEWMGSDKMRPYLRPATLLGDKFEEYLAAPNPEGLETERKRKDEAERLRVERDGLASSLKTVEDKIGSATGSEYKTLKEKRAILQSKLDSAERRLEKLEV